MMFTWCWLPLPCPHSPTKCFIYVSGSSQLQNSNTFSSCFSSEVISKYAELATTTGRIKQVLLLYSPPVLWKTTFCKIGRTGKSSNSSHVYEFPNVCVDIGASPHTSLSYIYPVPSFFPVRILSISSRSNFVTSKELRLQASPPYDNRNEFLSLHLNDTAFFPPFIVVARWECGLFPTSSNFSTSSILIQSSTRETGRQSNPASSFTCDCCYIPNSSWRVLSSHCTLHFLVMHHISSSGHRITLQIQDQFFTAIPVYF